MSNNSKLPQAARDEIRKYASLYSSDALDAAIVGVMIVSAITKASPAADIGQEAIEILGADALSANSQELGKAINTAKNEHKRTAKKAGNGLQIKLMPQKDDLPTMIGITGMGRPKTLSGKLLTELFNRQDEVKRLIEQGDNR